jgi:hypothetical protein
MKNGSSNQVSALFVRTEHSVWHHDWKIIVGVIILFALDAAWVGWKGASPRRRRRRY